MKSTEAIELFSIFSETWGKEKAQVVVKDIEAMVDSERQKLATKGDLREIELKLTKEIEQAKSSTIKWVVGWMVTLVIAQTGAISAIFMLLK
jgi:hypothetical protein